jgi:hypothetical protein
VKEEHQMLDATLMSLACDSNSATRITESAIILANRDLLCCELTEGAVILDMKSGVYYGLDPVGTFVWGLIQTPKTLAEITDAVMDEYSVDAERCRQDLESLFAEMATRLLVEIRNA